VEVSDNPQERRYEASLDGEVVGFMEYELREGLIALRHTEVDPAFRERGIASQLVAGVLDDVRGRGLTVRPICPFVRAYIARHSEYADLVRPKS
jgi:uncharacterized protein